MGIFEQIIAVCKGHEGEKFSSNEIKNKVEKQFGIKRGSILPPDYCYNRINDGINFTHHFFEEINGIYKYSAISYKKTFIILPFFEVLAIVMLFFIKLNPNQVESK